MYIAGVFFLRAYSLASSLSHDIYIVTLKLFPTKCHEQHGENCDVKQETVH